MVCNVFLKIYNMCLEKIISASIRQFLHSNGNGVTEENKPSEEEKEDSMEAPEKILMELTKGKLVASDVTKSSESIVEPVAKQPRIDATAIADATSTCVMLLAIFDFRSFESKAQV